MTTTSLLPSNATAWERSHSTVSERLLAAPVALILKERDPASCDAQFLAPLGWERSVHFWDPADDAGNRARVASSFVDHCGYGAPAALEAEIALDVGALSWAQATGLPVYSLDVAPPSGQAAIVVREFWEVPGYSWPDFAVFVVVNPGDPQPDTSKIYASALRRKPPRDVLAEVRIVAATTPAPSFFGAGVGAFISAKILPAATPAPQLNAGAGVGAFVSAKILPRGA